MPHLRNSNRTRGAFFIHPAAPGEPTSVEAIYDEKPYTLEKTTSVPGEGPWEFRVRFSTMGGAEIDSSRALGARMPTSGSERVWAASGSPASVRPRVRALLPHILRALKCPS